MLRWYFAFCIQAVEVCSSQSWEVFHLWREAETIREAPAQAGGTAAGRHDPAGAFLFFAASKVLAGLLWAALTPWWLTGLRGAEVWRSRRGSRRLQKQRFCRGVCRQHSHHIHKRGVKNWSVSYCCEIHGFSSPALFVLMFFFSLFLCRWTYWNWPER